MANYGFTIRMLVVQGVGKKDAILIFNKGLNVVAGASDTGKSFAFECINYVLGAKDVPLIPNEAKGYDDVLLEIQENKTRQIVTLKRSFKESEKKNIFYAFTDFENIDVDNFETLSAVHGANNSLSKRLMNLCNCSYDNILKGTAKGTTEAFSFRRYAHISMINETRIVFKTLPVYSADTRSGSEKTSELSTLFTILTGLDYKKDDKTEDVEVTKARLKGRIDELSLLCNELRLENGEIEASMKTIDFNQLENEIELLSNKIKEHKVKMQKEEDTYKRLNDVLRIYLSEKSRMAENLAKFNLLKRNYKSDIERLSFIEQSHNYTNQLVSVRCPTCNAPVEVKQKTESNDIYYLAVDKEKQKLNAHLNDLEGTISDFEDDLTEHDIMIERKQFEIAELEKILQKKSLEITGVIERYEEYLKIRDEVVKVKTNEKKLIDMNIRITELNDKIDSTKAKDNKVEIKKLSEDLMKDFCEIIKEFLNDWNFMQGDVSFDGKANDIVVNDKAKGTYGKGARAIINSAFVLSIMKYCLKRNLPHNAFVILDSPLTTYKERDKLAMEKKEDVSKNIKELFFRNLAEVKGDCQIIIFDNELPPNDLKNITYHHFTGNPEIERSGFIPN